mmetsp:Transcript_18495/g.48778  ORF Transcript_18495/g.48778 Transcript_18495/m.48778 type:complete len:144 (+) Transcript_18495:104-535(+)
MRTGYASFTGISSSLGDVLKNAASDQTHALKQFQAAVRQIYEETWASYYKGGIDVMVEMFSVSGFLKPKHGSMGTLNPGPDGFPYDWFPELTEMFADSTNLADATARVEQQLALRVAEVSALVPLSRRAFEPATWTPSSSPHS